jgi:hypothetical protein
MGLSQHGEGQYTWSNSGESLRLVYYYGYQTQWHQKTALGLTGPGQGSTAPLRARVLFSPRLQARSH